MSNTNNVLEVSLRGLMGMVKIAPSILAADLSKLAEEIKLVEEGGADFLHFDIMDGRFVPNLSFGPMVIKSIRDKTQLPLEVHLMVEEPEQFITSFIKAGADMVTIHVECFHSLYSNIKTIKNLNKKVGITLNPPTPLNTLEYLLDDSDMILIMSVDPGFGGQRFRPAMLPKIKAARQIIDDKEMNIDLAVDGGINEKTAPLAVNEGANVLVAGSSIFHSKNPKTAIERLRQSLR